MNDVNQSYSDTYCNACGVKAPPASKFCFGCGEILYQQNITHSFDRIPATAPASVHWISNHWRGEFSLAQSFWMFFFFPNLFYEIAHWLVMLYADRLWQFQIFAVIITARYPVLLWQAVGCWRSTLRHINQTGKMLWAQAAQLVIFLSVATALTITGGPTDITYFQIATKFGSAYTLTIPDIDFVHLDLNDAGETLAIQGAVLYGIAEEVDEILEQSPNITVISLDSPGGYVGAGIQLRDVIASHNLSTYVGSESECTSACTDVFMGGINRLMAYDAALGFHRSDLTFWDEQDTQDTIDELLKYGVSEEFANRVAQVDNDDVWYPNLDELISNNIVTHYFDEAGNLVPVQSAK